MVVEEVLKLLVGEIDKKLLKAVNSEALKTENVQDADLLVLGAERLALGAEKIVAAGDNPAVGG